MGQQCIEQCINEEYSVTLGLTADGELMLSGRDGHPENVNFRENYAGYYPACEFTAIACKEGTFYAAGIDAEGKPHLFASLMGRVWSETKLIDFHAKCQASGKIVRILYEEEENQMYLERRLLKCIRAAGIRTQYVELHVSVVPVYCSNPDDLHPVQIES